MFIDQAVRVPQFISVILTTYNQPEWLTKVLWGYACQTHRDFEIVIADDGSDDRTIEAIDRIRNQTDLKIEHVWLADDESSQSIILNQAIVRASGDYLLFSDGDCVPRNTFVDNHRRFACRDTFLSGGYFALPVSISQSLTIDDIATGRAFQWGFLRNQGLNWSRRYLRFVAGRYFANVLNRITTTRPTWNRSNCSGWKDDILSVNGFDERLKQAALDRELGERLENAGVHGRHIRYNTVVLQLDHAPRMVDPGDWQRSDQIRQAVQAERRTWTDYGIRNTVGDFTEQLRRAA